MEPRTESSRIATLESNVENIVKVVSSLSGDVRALTDKFATTGKTDWHVMIGGAGLIVSLMTVLGYLAMTPLTDSTRQLEIMNLNHITAEGHMGSMKEVQALKANYEESKVRLHQEAERAQLAVKDLDTALQREMRDLNSGLENELKTKINGLDIALQREFNLSIQPMQKSLDRTIHWQDNHDKRVVGLNAAQWERIKALERVVYQNGSLDITYGKAPGS